MECGLFAELQGTEQLSGHGARWERKEEGNLRKRGSGGRTGKRAGLLRRRRKSYWRMWK